MLQLLGKVSKVKSLELSQSLGLLFLRVCIGLMMALGHGLGKFANFPQAAISFPDPLGVGHTLSMGLAIFAELLCSVLLVFGLFTRLAAVPLIITMLVAALIIHADDPWQKKEMALLYLVPFVTIFFAGPGNFSMDRVLFK